MTPLTKPQLAEIAARANIVDEVTRRSYDDYSEICPETGLVRRTDIPALIHTVAHWQARAETAEGLHSEIQCPLCKGEGNTLSSSFKDPTEQVLRTCSACRSQGILRSCEWTSVESMNEDIKARKLLADLEANDES